MSHIGRCAELGYLSVGNDVNGFPIMAAAIGQCVNHASFQALFLIKIYSNFHENIIYLSINNPEPSFECYLDVCDMHMVC